MTREGFESSATLGSMKILAGESVSRILFAEPRALTCVSARLALPSPDIIRGQD